jgi:type I restriction-modification system DNA methylase subunit
LEWWIQGTTRTELRESVSVPHLDNFFEKHRLEFAPDAIHRAKTLARFDKSWQLEFVDLGLMPLVEGEAGRKLEGLVERAVVGTKNRLSWKDITQSQGEWLLKSNFWLLAAKILKDKEVPSFLKLDLEDLDTVFKRVAVHYGAAAQVQAGSKQQAEALRQSAREIAQCSHLGLVSTEALAYLYENALITKETRKALGTHSTPAFLVDYILGKLRPWIEEIPRDRRYVFEPACGHAAFLLAAMRLLGELLPESISAPSKRHQYLRERLRGCDYDSFALEIARLSLTLADVPNPNGWHLERADMFQGDLLFREARQAMIVLANPPFENFRFDGKPPSVATDSKVQHVNKAAEMLWRILTKMKPGAVFGFVLPQGLLHSDDAASLREFIAKNFELAEICLLPDKDIFAVSEVESVILIGRRLESPQVNGHPGDYRRVRDPDVERFKRAYEATTQFKIKLERFSAKNNWNFFVPDLEEVWDFCRARPKFETIADIGQGLMHRSRSDPAFPKGALTESDRKRPGFAKGFARLRDTLLTCDLPDMFWLNLGSTVIRRPLHGTTIGIAQVLLNYARVSRGPWRLKAFIDRKGHPFTSNFLAARPREKIWPLEAIWAVCNSPFANAFSYAFSMKRHVLAGLMREMPVPSVESKDLKALVKLVRAYFRAAHQPIRPSAQADSLESLRVLHWRIDAEVLRLYNLPARLERQVLDLFCGSERRGVPFRQTEYLPKTFPEPVTLRQLLAITVDWDQTNNRRAQLILKEERKTIRPAEQTELENLQRLADIRMDLFAPLPIPQIDAIATDLKRRGIWIGG